MKVAGITAEYNPFHRGHEYMIHCIRGMLGDDAAVVCAMSGNFVQRGDCALFQKHARAEAAVRCGVDLVLELPLPWAVSSAEGFARGAVELFKATGVVTHLCFGSESGDVDALEQTALALLSPELDGYIKRALSTGAPYAPARQWALEQVTGHSGELISRPNNILAVEYLKAMHTLAADMTPLTVKRFGAEHDGGGDGVFFSASELRRCAGVGEDILPHLPAPAAEVFHREMDAGRGPVTKEKLETALLSRLRMLPLTEFEALPDAAEGLEFRLYEAVHSQPSLEHVLSAAKTKRYAMSRLRRMLLCACLGVRAGDRDGGIPYIEVLAMSHRGRELLRRVDGVASLPVIIKPAAVKELDARARHIFQLDAGASDLFSLGFGNIDERRPGSDWRSSPFVL